MSGGYERTGDNLLGTVYPAWERVYARYQEVKDYKRVASDLNMNYHTVRGYVSKYKSAVTSEPSAVVDKVPALPVLPLTTYTGQDVPTTHSRYDGAWHFELSECMVAGDLHIPTVNYGFLEKMVRVAEKHMKDRRVLILVGDVNNGDRDSVHAPLAPEISRAREFQLVAETFHYLLNTFDEIYMTPGNHLRKRFAALLDQDATMPQIVRMMTDGRDHERVHLSPYDYVTIVSGGEKWVATHQYEYSKLKLRKADELAQKFQASTLVFHQHHTAIGRDRYNRYTIVDVGGFHDHELMAYVGLVPNSHNVMNRGFVYLRNGCAHLMTPYASMTDWSLWL